MERRGLILRSMLFVPANVPKMIAKATACEEDAVILDLEDSVPVEEKESGRKASRESLLGFKSKGIATFVRINPIRSGFAEDDLRFVGGELLDGVVLPKTDTRDEVLKTAQILEEVEPRRGSTCIMPLVESPKGLLNVEEIASASGRVIAVGLGAGDFLKEMGVGFAVTKLLPEEYFPSILYARSRIAITARSLGVHAIDTPYFGSLTDIDGLRVETERSRLLGYSGKMVIHPSHVAPVNAVFSPSEQDVEYAKKVLAAYKEAEAHGLGSATFDGRMIDYAMYQMGVELLGRAEAIDEKKKQIVRREDSAKC